MAIGCHMEFLETYGQARQQAQKSGNQKITINRGLIDLGQIDLLVQEDFIPTARTRSVRPCWRQPVGYPRLAGDCRHPADGQPGTQQISSGGRNLNFTVGNKKALSSASPLKTSARSILTWPITSVSTTNRELVIKAYRTQP